MVISPTSRDKLALFIINIKKLLAAIQSIQQNHYSYLLIMGDFNFPYINWDYLATETGTTSVSQLVLDAIQDGFLTQQVISPTRYRCTQNPSTFVTEFDKTRLRRTKLC